MLDSHDAEPFDTMWNHVSLVQKTERAREAELPPQAIAVGLITTPTCLHFRAVAALNSVAWRFRGFR